MKKSRKILKWATVILAVVTLCLALYIMWNRLGLSPAYFYADDPAIQDLSDRAAYTTSVPKWIHYALFFVWGALMWLLWKWVDRRK